MKTSLFELYKIGIGPSSSHTVGPMRAARDFVMTLARDAALSSVARVQVELHGSLALTGNGHGTDKAILLGLAREVPDTVEPASIAARLDAIRLLGQSGRDPRPHRPEWLRENPLFSNAWAEFNHPTLAPGRAGR